MRKINHVLPSFKNFWKNLLTAKPSKLFPAARRGAPELLHVPFPALSRNCET